MKLFLILTGGTSLANVLSGGALLPPIVAAAIFALNAVALIMIATRPRRGN